MASTKIVVFLLFLLMAVATSDLFGRSNHWTNSWVVVFKNDMEDKAVDELATRHGFKNRKQVSFNFS